MAPSAGISGSTASQVGETGGTVRSRASMPRQDSTPAARRSAMARVAPERE